MLQTVPYEFNGLNLDQQPRVVPANFWTEAQNITFRLGYAEAVKGMDAVFASASLLGPPIWLLNAPNGGTNYWIYADTQEVGVTDGTTHTDLTNTVSMTDVSAIPQPWTGGLLNGVPFLNNGSDPPKTWDFNTSNDLTTLPGWPASTECAALRAFRNFLVAMDMTESSTRLQEKIRWSNSAAAGALPSAWTASATNDAGDAVLADTSGAVIDGLQLGQSFMMYKRGSAYRMEYVGGNFVMDIRLAFRSLGVLARNCIAEVYGQHVVLSDGDIVLTDGNQARSLADKRVKSYFFSRLNAAAIERSYVTWNRGANEVLVCGATGSSTYPNLALVWNLDNDQWGLRDLPGTNGLAFLAPGIVDPSEGATWSAISGSWAAQSRLWDSATFNDTINGLLGAQPEATAAASKLLAYDVGSDLDGDAYTVRLQRTTLDCGTSRVKTLRRVWPLVEGSGTVAVSAKGSPEDSDNFGSPVSFTGGTDDKVDVSATGRYFGVRLDGFTSVQGFVLEYAERGRF